ncbi:MAG: heme biosynthesis HemY N-terminal domain-containing protein [Cycloclasticus sp.]
MKLILILILALVLAAGLAQQVHLDPGYVLLVYGTWSVETSLAILLFIGFITFIGFYFALRTLLTLKRAPKNIGVWNSRRKLKQSKKELNKGLIDSAEGNWQRSEKLLMKHAQQSETPLLNYLSAAHAAQSQGAFDRRDDYLFNAGEALPEHIHAIHLTRAKLQLSAGQFEQALATLQQLKTATPKHPVVLTLLMKTYAQLKDWNALYELLPAIKRNRKIASEDWQAIEQNALINLFNPTVGNKQLDMGAIWKNLDKKQKLEAEYIRPYATHLISTANTQLAEEVLKNGLGMQTDNSLLALYCQLDIEADKKIKQLEKWLKNSASNIELLNALAELCLQKELWGKTKTYLEQSFAIEASASAYFLMGQLLEAQGEPLEKATAYYKDALKLNKSTAIQLL